MFPSKEIAHPSLQQELSKFSNRDQVYHYIVQHKLVSGQTLFGPVSDDELSLEIINDISFTKLLPDSVFVNLQ